MKKLSQTKNLFDPLDLNRYCHSLNLGIIARKSTPHSPDLMKWAFYIMQFSVMPRTLLFMVGVSAFSRRYIQRIQALLKGGFFDFLYIISNRREKMRLVFWVVSILINIYSI